MSQLSAAIVLAAGEGKRMHSSTPKVLHPVCGVPLLGHVLSTVSHLSPAQTTVVIGHGKVRVQNYLTSEFKNVHTAIQEKQNGTGHAVQTALASMKEFKGLVLIISGDTPLISPESLKDLIKVAHQNKAAVLTAILDNPDGYGRVVRNGENVTKIVEDKDASASEKLIQEINTGVYIFDVQSLNETIKNLNSKNSQNELYLTDVVELMTKNNINVGIVKCEDSTEALGVNDRAQLATSQQIMQQRINEHWMQKGVTMRNPDSVVIDITAEFEQDVFIDSNCHLLGNTRIAKGVQIGPDTMLKDCVVGENSHLLRTTANDAKIGANAEIGPYTYLRPGTILEDGTKAGAYVEIKNSVIGKGSKVPHLSYVGDATIGEGTNIGAATVFVNYDGEKKHHTVVGDNVRIGSDTMLVAPVTIGDGAYTAAGSVITEDVPSGALGVERTKQRNIAGWVERKRANSKSADSARRAQRNK